MSVLLEIDLERRASACENVLYHVVVSESPNRRQSTTVNQFGVLLILWLVNPPIQCAVKVPESHIG